MPGFQFPTQNERQQLLKQLREMEQPYTDSQLYKNYQESLARLEACMDELCAVNEKGICDPLTREAGEDLLKLMIRTAEAGETFLGSLEDQEKSLKTPVPGMVNKLQGIMARDFAALMSYDVRNPQSLPEIIEKARTQTVDLNGYKLSTVGNMQSSRIPMTLTNAQNEVRRGMFTKASYVTNVSEFKQVLENAKQYCSPEGREELDKVLDNYRDYLVKNKVQRRDGTLIRSDDSEEHVVGMFNRHLGSTFGRHSYPLEPKQIQTFLHKFCGIKTRKLSPEAIQSMAEGFASFRGNIGRDISNWNLELKDGVRVDSRNSCMSAVAGMLGVSHLIARSRNMNFTDENGNVVEGTFMDYGKGLDLSEHPYLFRHLSSNPFKKKGQLMKQLADLNIVDYLCMNVDRHQGNMLYQVDSKGNLIGVQGIDNDSSFGKRNVAHHDLKSLKIISESMARRVGRLTPEMLKFSLRGKGLSAEEMEAAAKRLTILKAQIQKKKIRVVSDEEMSKLDFKDLKPEKYGSNTFETVDQFIKDAKRNGLISQGAFVPFQGYSTPSLTAIPTLGRKGTVGGMEDTLRKVAVLTTTKPTGLIAKIRGQSQNFTDLENAAKAGRALFEQMSASDKIDMKAMLNEPEAKPVLESARATFADISEKAAKYLNGKLEERGVDTLEELRGKNPHEQAHIDYAIRALKLVDEFNAHLEGPKNEKERGEKTSASELREMEQRKKLWKDMSTEDRQDMEKELSGEKVENGPALGL